MFNEMKNKTLVKFELFIFGIGCPVRPDLEAIAIVISVRLPLALLSRSFIKVVIYCSSVVCNNRQTYCLEYT